jgi:pimeloyl-ACP methyl ester carboxylesterase
MIVRVFIGAMVLLLLLTSTALRAQPTSGPAPLPDTQPMSRQELEPIIRAELGKLYDPAQADKLYSAAIILEQYFARPDARANITRALDGLGLDANIIGRLCRVRVTWPQLPAGIYYINERVGPHDVRYFLGIPRNYDRTKPWPLVLKLPGAEAFVTEPRPDPIQVTSIYAAWINDELGRHPDAVIIMPLLNLDDLWGPSYAGMNYAVQPVLHAPNIVNIDPSRVYMVGHSMSGHAVWNLALHHPTYFASFTALAGVATQDWQRVRMMNLRNILPVVWHDADDTLLKVDLSRQIVKAVRGLKFDIDYHETKGVGHVPSDAIYEQCYTRMRGRTRELYPKQVSLQSSRPDTRFNRSDWVQIYQPLRPGEEKKVFFTRGTGHMIVFLAAWMADATIDQNQINVNATNIESMRFYVNDQMVDFSRPVNVTVNRRQRYQGTPKSSLEEMLKDQLFMGRGWRYYTAVIDIDFGAEPPSSGRTTTRPTRSSE